MKKIRKVLSLVTALVMVISISSTVLAAEEAYTVKSGDVLWKIAEAHGTTWEKLAEMNSLDNPNLIFPGQMLMVSAPMAEAEMPAEEPVVSEPVEETPAETVEEPVEEMTYMAEPVLITSREVEIPGVFTYPLEGENFPLVVFAHGHGGSKDEAGGFVQAAAMLAEQGVASVRVDFPGCGESTEPWTQNSLTNMLQDIESSLNYAIDSGKVDANNVSIYGYSMGGRLAMLSAAANPIYKSVALWAPAATNGPDSMYVFMGGQEAYESYDAIATEEGQYLFTTLWGQEQMLSAKFFEDMRTSTPIDDVATYEGPVLIVNGELDTIIDQTVVDAAAAAFTASSDVTTYTVIGADHGFGLYSAEPELTAEALKVTVDFLVEQAMQ